MKINILLIISFLSISSLCITAQNIENRLFSFSENNKRYYVNIEGERVTDAIYDNNYSASIEDCDKGWIGVRKNELCGAIDVKGKVLIPCIYEDMMTIESEWNVINYLGCKKKEKYGIVDTNNQEIVPFLYDDMSFEIVDNDIIMLKKGRWGALSIKDGKAIIPFVYEKWDIYNSNGNILFLLCDKNGNYGAINTKGRMVIPFVFCDYQIDFDNKYIIVKDKNNRWYVYETSGKRKELCSFDDIGYASNGFLDVKKNGFWGCVNLSTGKVTTPFIYKEVSIRFNGTITKAKKKDGTCVVINKFGSELATIDELCDYHSSNPFKDGLITAYRDGKVGCLNSEGTTIIPFVYDILIHLDGCELFAFEKNNLWGIVDYSNNVLVQPQYSSITKFDGGGDMFTVKKNEKWGVVNRHNEVLIPLIYDRLYVSEEKGEVFAEVELNGKKGLLDSRGNEIFWCDEDYFYFKKAQYQFSQTPSDVDLNIPTSTNESVKTFAVIIANEQYAEDNISQVKFAQNDGNSFKAYCNKTLGIPNKNIKYVSNATVNQMRSAINWATDIAKAFDGDTKLIVYYSGHGIPDEKTGNAYLLPSDGIVGDFRSAYSLDELYKQPESVSAKQTTVFLDACFSGASKDGKMMLADSRGVAIKAKAAIPKGNMIVFSACSGDETAFPYKKKKHEMFTYFSLKKLQETSGNVSMKELGTYIKKQVRQTSMTENRKIQTPTINASASILDKMKVINL